MTAKPLRASGSHETQPCAGFVDSKIPRPLGMARSGQPPTSTMMKGPATGYERTANPRGPRVRRACEIGTSGNPALDIAKLHVMLSVSNCSYSEWRLPAQARQFGLTADLKPNAQARTRISRGPGLGYEIDWRWVEKHRIGTMN